MTPAAEVYKACMIERYEYCVEDHVAGYENKLNIALGQPDEYWENQVGAVDGSL
jgi:hypothetical protein